MNLRSRSNCKYYSTLHTCLYGTIVSMILYIEIYPLYIMYDQCLGSHRLLVYLKNGKNVYTSTIIR